MRSDDPHAERVLLERLAQVERELETLQQTAAVLRAREERLRLSLDAADVGTWEWNVLTGKVRWSDNLERIHGQAPGSFKGTFEGFLDGVNGEDREGVLKAIQQATEEGKDYNIEYRSRSDEGTQIWLEGRGRVIFDGAGQPHWMLGTCTNITERKQFQQQLRQTQKLESLGLLAGGVAHDFNNLLTGIIGNASLALSRLAPADSARPLLQDVMLASQRTADLTRQLLAYAGKGRFVIENIELSGLVQEIIPLVRTSIPESVQLHLDLTPMHIKADASQIGQLVMNLIINAVEAIGSGNAGTVFITTNVQEVSEPAAERLPVGKYGCLEVRDTGCGMEEATIARIFDPFFSTKFTGRGLGLAAALGIVRGHHGTITVQSTPGTGATFTVMLPASDTESMPTQTDPGPSDLAGSGIILVVDDEELVLRMAQASLLDYGYSPLLASSGRSALDIAGKSGDRIRAVVLDLTMPEMTGEETLQQLRVILPRLPVIIASGYGETEVNQRFAGKGISGFLQKPYSPVQLARMIRSVLSSKADGTAS